MPADHRVFFFAENLSEKLESENNFSAVIKYQQKKKRLRARASEEAKNFFPLFTSHVEQKFLSSLLQKESSSFSVSGRVFARTVVVRRWLGWSTPKQ